MINPYTVMIECVCQHCDRKYMDSLGEIEEEPRRDTFGGFEIPKFRCAHCRPGCHYPKEIRAT